MNKNRAFFLGYIVTLLGISVVHNIAVLATLFALFLLVAKERVYLLKRAFLAVAFFSLIISIAYVFKSFMSGEFSSYFLLLFNIRVLLLTFVSFWFFHTISIFVILPKNIARVFVLAFGQVLHFIRLYKEFIFGVYSRWSGFGYKKWMNSLKGLTLFFLNKSFYNSKEMSQGMRSRGFFDD